MKYYKTIIFASIFILLISPATAQKFSNDNPITIENLSAEKIWQIVEMAMNENNIPVGKFNMEQGVLMSDWIEWSAIAIQNHAHLYYKYDSPNLVLKIADREYKSDKGWSEAIGSLSKKKYAEYMQVVADRIIEINKDEALTRQAVKTSKLIPAFNPVNTVGEVVLTLKETSYTELRPLLKFDVQNKASHAVTVDIPITNLYASVTGGANSYGGHKWSRPDEKMPRQAVIQPGEILPLIVEYDYKWKSPIIQRLELKIICKSAADEKTQILKIFQIPLENYIFNPEDK
jgi:hypothetical protein